MAVHSHQLEESQRGSSLRAAFVRFAAHRTAENAAAEIQRQSRAIQSNQEHAVFLLTVRTTNQTATSLIQWPMMMVSTPAFW